MMKLCFQEFVLLFIVIIYSLPVKTREVMTQFPRSCNRDHTVLTCAAAEDLDTKHLAEVVQFELGLDFIFLQSSTLECHCKYMDLVKMLKDTEIVVLASSKCTVDRLAHCGVPVPVSHPGVVAGLLVSDTDARVRWAIKHHVISSWYKVEDIANSELRTVVYSSIVKDLELQVKRLNPHWNNSHSFGDDITRNQGSDANITSNTSGRDDFFQAQPQASAPPGFMSEIIQDFKRLQYLDRVPEINIGKTKEEKWEIKHPPSESELEAVLNDQLANIKSGPKANITGREMKDTARHSPSLVEMHHRAERSADAITRSILDDDAGSKEASEFTQTTGPRTEQYAKRIHYQLHWLDRQKSMVSSDPPYKRCLRMATSEDSGRNRKCQDSPSLCPIVGITNKSLKELAHFPKRKINSLRSYLLIHTTSAHWHPQTRTRNENTSRCIYAKPKTVAKNGNIRSYTNSNLTLTPPDLFLTFICVHRQDRSITVNGTTTKRRIAQNRSPSSFQPRGGGQTSRPSKRSANKDRSVLFVLPFRIFAGGEFHNIYDSLEVMAAIARDVTLPPPTLPLVTSPKSTKIDKLFRSDSRESFGNPTGRMLGGSVVGTVHVLPNTILKPGGVTKVNDYGDANDDHYGVNSSWTSAGVAVGGLALAYHQGHPNSPDDAADIEPRGAKSQGKPQGASRGKTMREIRQERDAADHRLKSFVIFFVAVVGIIGVVTALVVLSIKEKRIQLYGQPYSKVPGDDTEETRRHRTLLLEEHERRTQKDRVTYPIYKGVEPEIPWEGPNSQNARAAAGNMSDMMKSTRFTLKLFSQHAPVAASTTAQAFDAHNPEAAATPTPVSGGADQETVPPQAPALLWPPPDYHMTAELPPVQQTLESGSFGGKSIVTNFLYPFSGGQNVPSTLRPLITPSRSKPRLVSFANSDLHEKNNLMKQEGDVQESVSRQQPSRSLSSRANKRSHNLRPLYPSSQLPEYRGLAVHRNRANISDTNSNNLVSGEVQIVSYDDGAFLKGHEASRWHIIFPDINNNGNPSEEQARTEAVCGLRCRPYECVFCPQSNKYIFFFNSNSKGNKSRKEADIRIREIGRHRVQKAIGTLRRKMNHKDDNNCCDLPNIQTIESTSGWDPKLLNSEAKCKHGNSHILESIQDTTKSHRWTSSIRQNSKGILKKGQQYNLPSSRRSNREDATGTRDCNVADDWIEDYIHHNVSDNSRKSLLPEEKFMKARSSIHASTATSSKFEIPQESRKSNSMNPNPSKDGSIRQGDGQLQDRHGEKKNDGKKLSLNTPTSHTMVEDIPLPYVSEISDAPVHEYTPRAKSVLMETTGSMPDIRTQLKPLALSSGNPTRVTSGRWNMHGNVIESMKRDLKIDSTSHERIPPVEFEHIADVYLSAKATKPKGSDPVAPLPGRVVWPLRPATAPPYSCPGYDCRGVKQAVGVLQTQRVPKDPSSGAVGSLKMDLPTWVSPLYKAYGIGGPYGPHGPFFEPAGLSLPFPKYTAVASMSNPSRLSTLRNRTMKIVRLNSSLKLKPFKIESPKSWCPVTRLVSRWKRRKNEAGQEMIREKSEPQVSGTDQPAGELVGSPDREIESIEVPAAGIDLVIDAATEDSEKHEMQLISSVDGLKEDPTLAEKLFHRSESARQV